jgi:hypothetical protein
MLTNETYKPTAKDEKDHSPFKPFTMKNESVFDHLINVHALKTLNWILELRTEFEDKYGKTPDYLLIHPYDYRDLLNDLYVLGNGTKRKAFATPAIVTTDIEYRQPVFVMR